VDADDGLSVRAVEPDLGHPVEVGSLDRGIELVVGELDGFGLMLIDAPGRRDFDRVEVERTSCNCNSQARLRARAARAAEATSVGLRGR
jgi:hypothetical protein